MSFDRPNFPVLIQEIQELVNVRKGFVPEPPIEIPARNGFHLRLAPGKRPFGQG
jgi:hypothetical protein